MESDERERSIEDDKLVVAFGNFFPYAYFPTITIDEIKEREKAILNLECATRLAIEALQNLGEAYRMLPQGVKEMVEINPSK